MRTDRLDRITEGGVIAILRGVGRDDAVAVADAVVDAGVTALEVTADTPNAMTSIEAIADRVDDAVVGAGTVLDAETARAAQLAGAEFLVTPTVNRGVIRTANRYGTPVAVGAYTPTEAIEAYEAGADA
ncbi:2-dehydro-3-deoxyphosphogluconate aldolase, partial [Halorubrum sp. E3]